MKTKKPDTLMAQQYYEMLQLRLQSVETDPTFNSKPTKAIWNAPSSENIGETELILKRIIH